MSSVHADRFSAGLDDLTRVQQQCAVTVLGVLQRTGRFSCFEAGENIDIARTMDRLLHKGLSLKTPDGTVHEYGQLVKTTGGEHPWTTCEVTPGGLRLLADIAAGTVDADLGNAVSRKQFEAAR